MLGARPAQRASPDTPPAPLAEREPDRRPADAYLVRDRRRLALLEPEADLELRVRGTDELEPVGGGAAAGRVGGDDLHHIAVVQGGRQRDEPAAQPRSDAAVAGTRADR